MRRSPPWLAQRLLAWLTPDWAKEDVVGDLIEVYRERARTMGPLRADLWAWRQVVAVRFRYWRHHSRPRRGFFPFLEASHEVGTGVQLAFRYLRKSPAYSVPAVVTLGLGIGAATAVFGVAHAVFLRALPFEDEGAVVVIQQTMPEAVVPRVGVSYPEIEDYREAPTGLGDIASYQTALATISGLGDPDRVFVGAVSHNYFGVLGVRPLKGRMFQPQDGTDRVVVLAHRYWVGRLGADPGVVGRSLLIDAEPYEIIGVAPPLPSYPNEDALYKIAVSGPRYAALETSRSSRRLKAIGRVAEGTSVEEVSRRIGGVAARFATTHPEAYPPSARITATAVPIRHEMTRSASGTVAMLAMSVALVLLLIAVNVCNMSLARIADRGGEMRVRRALGAGRGRLLWMQLAEGLWVSILGGALGAVLAYALTDPLAAWAARTTTHVGAIDPSVPTTIFALVMAFAVGMISTSLPLAWVPTDSIGRGGERSTASLGVRRFQHALLVGQVGLSMILVSAAILVGKTLVATDRVDQGFDSESVMTMRVALNPSYQGEQIGRSIVFFTTLLDRLNALPEVRSAAVGRDVPLMGGPARTAAIEIPSYEAELPPVADLRIVSPEYFRTLGLGLLRGRGFASSDDLSSPSVALVNKTFVDKYWGGLDPIGRVFTPTGGGVTRVIGVVSDVHHYGLDRPPTPEYFLNVYQRPLYGWHLFVRAHGDPYDVVTPVANAIHELDNTLPLHMIQSLDEVRGRGLMPTKMRAQLVGLFGFLSLIITCVGVFGLTTYAVNLRRREFGIRLALGAEPRSVLFMVLGETTSLVAIGLCLGVVGSFLFERVLDGFLFEASLLNPTTLLIPCLVVLGSTVVAACIPARVASQSDPTVILQP